MFTSKKKKSTSLPYFKWVRLLFTLTLFTVLFASCNDDDNPTLEEMEEERIENAKRGLVGRWEFTSSKITTPLAPEEDTDYRDIKATLGAVGVINDSELELNADGTYTFTNSVIGGDTYVLSGQWEYRNDPTFQEDFIQLEGLYNQLLNRIDADREFFNGVFVESFENFQVGTRTDNEIQLSNAGVILEEAGADAPPKDILVEGTYTITRQ